MAKVVIVHGLEGYKDENWFPWLTKELRNKGIDVWNETLPSPNNPIAKEWISIVLEQVEPDTILIGHSIGTPTILRIAERSDIKLKALFCIAGFQTEPDFPGHERISPFLQGGFDWDKIKDNAENIYIFDSNNDPYVPLEQGKILHEKLGGTHRTFSDRNHLNRWGETQTEGEQTFPEILEEILKLT